MMGDISVNGNKSLINGGSQSQVDGFNQLKQESDSSIKVSPDNGSQLIVWQKKIEQKDVSTTNTRPEVHNNPLPTCKDDHPHLGANFTEPLREVFNPKEINGTQKEGVIFEKLKEKGVIDDAGKIDFTKLGLSAKEIKKNQLEGKVWVDDNGKFQVKVNGFLGDGCIKAFSALKGEVGSVAQNNGLKNPITLDPNILGEPSAEDMEVMERGGQIQYHSFGDTNSPGTLKLVLDPGENGKNDGLTVSVLRSNEGSVKETRRSAKIPLSVVFGGQELEGKKTDHPLLENWRENRYFERSGVKTEWFFDKKTSDNTNSVGRIQAQNDLWKATNEYLRWTLNESESHKGVMAEIICGSDGVRNDETSNGEIDNNEMRRTRSNGYIGSSVRIEVIEDIPVEENSGNLKKQLGNLMKVLTGECKSVNSDKLLDVLKKFAGEMQNLSNEKMDYLVKFLQGSNLKDLIKILNNLEKNFAWAMQNLSNEKMDYLVKFLQGSNLKDLIKNLYNLEKIDKDLNIDEDLIKILYKIGKNIRDKGTQTVSRGYMGSSVSIEVVEDISVKKNSEDSMKGLESVVQKPEDDKQKQALDELSVAMGSKINEETQQAIKYEQGESQGKTVLVAKATGSRKRNNNNLVKETKNLGNAFSEFKKIGANAGNDKNEDLMKNLESVVQNPEALSNLDKQKQALKKLDKNIKYIKRKKKPKKIKDKDNNQDLINAAKELSNAFFKLKKEAENLSDNLNVDRLEIPKGNTERLR